MKEVVLAGGTLHPQKLQTPQLRAVQPTLNSFTACHLE